VSAFDCPHCGGPAIEPMQKFLTTKVLLSWPCNTCGRLLRAKGANYLVRAVAVAAIVGYAAYLSLNGLSMLPLAPAALLALAASGGVKMMTPLESAETPDDER
jgi:hypothetical protein